MVDISKIFEFCLSYYLFTLLLRIIDNVKIVYVLFCLKSFVSPLICKKENTMITVAFIFINKVEFVSIRVVMSVNKSK